MLYNITNPLLFCKKLNLTRKSRVDNTVQQQRYKNNNDKKKRPRKKSLLVTLHWKYPRKIAKCLYTFFQVQPRTASLAYTLPLPHSPRVDGKQEHKQLFPLSVPATLPEMTMHRASVCVYVCLCVVASLCCSLMAMACRHTGQRRMDKSPNNNDNNNSRWHRQRQRHRATLSKAEADEDEDEDIGFALHWRCKVVSNVKGSRQNSWVSFSHIYAVFLSHVFENSEQCFQWFFSLCGNSWSTDAN